MEEQQPKPAEQAPKAAHKKATAPAAKQLIAVRVRGRIRLLTGVKDTLNMLRLGQTNTCVVLDNTATNRGMIKKAKDYLTWGEADSSTVEELFTKKGELYKGPETDRKKKIQYKGRWVEFKGKKYKKVFRLNPPKKGYGRNGIKKPFSKGGALGNRGQKINDLVKRMM